MTTTTLPGTEVAVFAAAVRAALSDLSPDDLDELTDGLEADLAERADESGADLGDPAAYAEELRAAAGYPPRSARSHLGDALPDFRTLPQELRRRWEALLTRERPVAVVVEFLASLRPVWWVLRGLAVYATFVFLLSAGYASNATSWWPLALVAIVLSVQVGRGRMLGRRWVRWVTRIASAVAILVVPFVAGWTATQINLGLSSQYVYEDSFDYGTGLTSNGVPIDNIYAYDAEGNPIDQVQLFDQNGEPLNLVADPSVEYQYSQDGLYIEVPSADVPGRAGWNVFPLAHVSESEFDEFGNLDISDPLPAAFPVATVKPLAGVPTTTFENEPSGNALTPATMEPSPGN